jgi:hypothetical protein
MPMSERSAYMLNLDSSGAKARRGALPERSVDTRGVSEE